MGQCLETSLVVTTGGVGATGVEWGTARDAAKCPTMHWTVPHSKGLNSTQRPSAEVEKVSSKSVALKKIHRGAYSECRFLGSSTLPPQQFSQLRPASLGGPHPRRLAGGREARAPGRVGRGAWPRLSWDVPGSARGSCVRGKKKLTCVKCLSLSLSLSQASNCKEHATTNLSANDN